MTVLLWIVVVALTGAIFAFSAIWFWPRAKPRAGGSRPSRRVQRAHENTMVLPDWGGGTRTSRNRR